MRSRHTMTSARANYLAVVVIATLLRWLGREKGGVMSPSSWVLSADDGTLLTDPMDGQACSFARLERDGPESLWIAGGNSGRLLVILMKDEESQETLNLADPTQQGENVVLTIEGIRADYPPRYCVSREHATEAVGYYHRAGVPATHLAWEDPYLSQRTMRTT